MKIVLIVSILLPAYCRAQRSWQTHEASRLQITMPAMGVYSFSSAKLIDWIERNGKHAAGLTRGGDFINVIYSPGRLIVGASFGEVFPTDKTSSLTMTYVDIAAGVKLFVDNRWQLSLLSHASYTNYRIGDLIPADFTRPFDKAYPHYTRAWTLGEGPSLQLRLKVV